MSLVTVKRKGEADVILNAEQGCNIYALLSAAGLMDGACGGIGRCGKCKVKAPALPVAAGEKEYFSEDELSCGWRLACLHIIDGDITVELPSSAVTAVITDNGYMKQAETAPSVSKTFANGMTSVLRDGAVIAAEDSDTRNRLYGMAVDIGTTTVAAALTDMNSGATLARATCLNSQKAFGQDVISRIGYTMQNENGLAELNRAIAGDMASLCRELCESAGIAGEDIYEVTVAANSVMTHLLGNVDPSSLAAFPFLPAYTGPLRFPASDLRLPVSPLAEVFCLPAISSYVGGDITAGLLACDVRSLAGVTLFIDIGTNGEMVLSVDGKMYSCSCAAGPALEGMNISCGMRAAEGAIEDAVMDETGLHLKTIGNAAPRGICGSGLLALIGELVRNDIIKPNGRLAEHPSVVEEAGRKQFIVDAADDIRLTQNDIRQVQLAKGAILAGVDILLQQAGISAEQVDRVLVAGQFGAHLTEKSLLLSGLLPGAFAGHISYVGNTSLSGAILCLLNAKEKEIAASAAEGVEYVELSVFPSYEKALASAMRFNKITTP